MKMPWISRLSLLAVATCLSSGCMMYRLEELRRTAPAGNAFQNELSQLYMQFAIQEEKNYDWQDSWYFADKGLMLAYGKDVEPELLEDWNLPEEALAEMEKARIRVVEVLTPAFKASQPSVAASIQFHFDCWVEQQDERWQPEQIAECREGLMKALERAPGGKKNISAKPVGKIVSQYKAPATPKPLPDTEVESKPAMVAPEPVKEVPPNAPFKKAVPKDEPAKAEAKSAEAKPQAKEQAKPKDEKKDEKPASEAAKGESSKSGAKGGAKAANVETSSYAVFFEPKKTDMSTPGKNVLQEVIRSVKGKSDFVILLQMAAKPASEAEKELAQKRKDEVRRVLTEAGVDASAVVEGAAQAKPAARRIELFLNE